MNIIYKYFLTHTVKKAKKLNSSHIKNRLAVIKHGSNGEMCSIKNYSNKTRLFYNRCNSQTC